MCSFGASFKISILMFQNQQIHPTIKAKSRLKAVLTTLIDLITPNTNLCSCFVSLKVYFISPPNLG